MAAPKVLPVFGKFDSFARIAKFIFSVDLIYDLQKLLNFTFEFIEFQDEDHEVFGMDVHSNGSFNGMIGKLQQNEADVVLADIPITSGTVLNMKYGPP